MYLPQPQPLRLSGQKDLDLKSQIKKKNSTHIHSALPRITFVLAPLSFFSHHLLFFFFFFFFFFFSSLPSLATAVTSASGQGTVMVDVVVPPNFALSGTGTRTRSPEHPPMLQVRHKPTPNQNHLDSNYGPQRNDFWKKSD